MNRLTALLDRIVETIEDLSPRDRRIALALVGIVVVLFVGGITWGLQGVLSDRASRVRVAKEHLVEAQDLAAEYEGLALRLGDVEARMGQFKPSQINTYVEGWAGAAGVLPMLKEVRETGAETVGDYRKRDYRVEIQEAPLEGLVRFLHAVETSPYPIKVRSAHLKARSRKDERPLDLQLELVTFAKEEG